MPKVTFQTDDFQNAHGAEPKGEGNWRFTVLAAGPRGYSALRPFSGFGTFARLKKAAATAARTEARDISGVDEIIITVEA